MPGKFFCLLHFQEKSMFSSKHRCFIDDATFTSLIEANTCMHAGIGQKLLTADGLPQLVHLQCLFLLFLTT